jgi:uncharacterized membrane protein YphA (DoxX/SURF4 family)
MIGVVCAVVLGGVFLIAGGSKITAGEMWPRQATDLGAPRFAVLVLPWWELLVGAVLIAQVAPAAAAAAAIVTLVAFTGLIAARLQQGRRPPCACFGAWSASPIGWQHVARNIVMIGVGAVVIAAR